MGYVSFRDGRFLFLKDCHEGPGSGWVLLKQVLDAERQQRYLRRDCLDKLKKQMLEIFCLGENDGFLLRSIVRFKKIKMFLFLDYPPGN